MHQRRMGMEAGPAVGVVFMLRTIKMSFNQVIGMWIYIFLYFDLFGTTSLFCWLRLPLVSLVVGHFLVSINWQLMLHYVDPWYRLFSLTMLVCPGHCHHTVYKDVQDWEFPSLCQTARRLASLKFLITILPSSYPNKKNLGNLQQKRCWSHYLRWGEC